MAGESIPGAVATGWGALDSSSRASGSPDPVATAGTDLSRAFEPKMGDGPMLARSGSKRIEPRAG